MSALNHSLIRTGEADPSRWLLLLHGIFGSGRNWATLARRVVGERPEWGVILVDLRLHGESSGFAPPHTLEAVAGDVERLIDSLDLPISALLGHSYGGKVALLAGQARPRHLSQIWVVDSTLEAREPSGSAWQVIEAVKKLPDRFASRAEMVEGMVGFGFSRPLANWLGMNLERDGDVLRWRIDWSGAEEMVLDYFRTDAWEIVEQPKAGTEIHIVRASESGAIGEDGAARVTAIARRHAGVFLHEVEGGHWINVDNPDSMVALLADHLP